MNTRIGVSLLLLLVTVNIILAQTTVTTNPHIENSYGWCIDIAPTPNTTVKTIGNGTFLSVNKTCDANSILQNWLLKLYSNSTNSLYSIEISGPNDTAYCVAVPVSLAMNSGIQMQLWECNYNVSQLWTMRNVTTLDPQGNPGFQLVNEGNSRCLDQNPVNGVNYLSQWGCYPKAPSDIIGQTWHELNCPLTGCNIIGSSITFNPLSSTIPSTSFTLTSASASASTPPSDKQNITINSGIVGGIIGVIILVAIVIGIGIFFCLKRTQRHKPPNGAYGEYYVHKIDTSGIAATGMGYTPVNKQDFHQYGGGSWPNRDSWPNRYSWSSKGTDITFDANTVDTNFEHRNSTNWPNKTLDTSLEHRNSTRQSSRSLLSSAYGFITNSTKFNKPEERDPSEPRT